MIVALILGDNVSNGSTAFKKAFREFKDGGSIFAYEVQDPERYGVVEFDEEGKAISVEENQKTKTNFAIPGLYIFDNKVVKVAKSLDLQLEES